MVAKNKLYDAELVTSIKNLTMDEDESLFIEGYANTISKDRAGDIIPKETWEKTTALENYKKNPIILAFHDHSLPIGKTVEVQVTEFGLYIKAKISKAADKIYSLIKDGVLSTFSVGFRIKDARYDQTSDTFFITDVELTEVSVVSVPCNQDSIFSISKSMKSAEFADFKDNFIQPQSADKEKPKMTDNVKDFDVDAFKREMAQAAAKAAVDAQNAAEAARQKALQDEAERKAAAQAADAKVKTVATDAAKALVDELRTALKAKDDAFAESVKAHQEQIVAMKDEIASLVASRTSPITQAVRAGNLSAAKGEELEEVNRVVMLGMIKKVDMFETNYGKKHFNAMKAVNVSSSIQVSSESYETTFSNNLMRDIQGRLVVANLFREIPMSSKQLTIPINPNRKNASWVDAGDYGTDGSSGNEIQVALTERTLKTFKLAAKTYLTEETDEDAILAVLPILRDHLVEAHANEIDRAFLLGTGTGQPKGLVTQALAIGAGATKVSTATATGTVKVTAKELLQTRRLLGLYGIKLSEISLVISQEAYWDLLEDPEWADVQQVNTAAVKLQGEVGNIYGMPVIVSDQFEARAASKPFAVLVNRSNFVVPRQRGATVRTDFDVEKDRRVFVATQRLNLEPLIEQSAGNGKGVAIAVYAA